MIKPTVNLVDHAEHSALSWDQQRVKDLLCAPNRLLHEQPWSSWIHSCGGLAAIYAQLRALPLPDPQAQLLGVLLDLPHLPVRSYAAHLSIDRATFFRHRAALVELLLTYLRKDDSAAFAQPAAHAQRGAGSLPHSATPFVGRAKELVALCRLLLQGQSRLLTLFGPGGCGKSRLAARAGQLLSQGFRDGVAWVGLDDVVEPQQLLPRIAAALGLSEQPDQPLLASVREWLRPRQLLLILDNCEQLRKAAPLIVDLLERAPELKVLTTSRAILHLRGEALFALAPLTLPAEEHQLAGSPCPLLYEQLAESDAVRLFVERAQALSPEFVLTPQNAQAVAAICARADGLPLAIELAATQMRFLSPQAMLTCLDQGLALLSGGAQDLPQRQQSMRQLYDWSYGLLDADAQQLFRQLGLLEGGWTLGQAEQLCRAVCSGAPDLVRLLGALLDQSLVRKLPAPAGLDDCYAMLSTARDYALDLLEQHGEAALLRARPALYRGERVAQLRDGFLPGPALGRQVRMPEQVAAHTS